MGIWFGGPKSVSSNFRLLVCIGKLAGQTFFKLCVQSYAECQRFLNETVKVVNVTKESFCQFPWQDESSVSSNPPIF